MVERVLRVGIAIQVQVKLRVIGPEFRPLLTQEPVESHSVTVGLGVGEVCQYFGNRKPRSEERRVGKECGARGWRCREEDKVRDDSSVWEYWSGWWWRGSVV